MVLWVMEKSWQKQRWDEVRHLITEKYHSLYCWCFNFPLDQSQKGENVKWCSRVDKGTICYFGKISPTHNEGDFAKPPNSWLFPEIPNSCVLLLLAPTAKDLLVNPLLLISQLGIRSSAGEDVHFIKLYLVRFH